MGLAEVNNRIEKVETFKTSDGKIFEDEFEACLHQEKLNFKEWYEVNKPSGNYAGSYVEADDMVEWLMDNAEKVRNLIGDS